MSNKPNIPLNGVPPKPPKVVAGVQILVAEDGRMNVNHPEDIVLTLNILTDALKMIAKSGKLANKTDTQVKVVNPLDIPKEMMGRG